MNIHEYQAKAVLSAYGVAVPSGKVAFSPEEAESAAKELKSPVLVVKAQIHAGGRGKAGGVKLVKSPEAAAEATRELLGKILVTHQTGPEGKEVRKVYVESGSNIKKEYYLSAVLDRDVSGITFIASTEGGMEIEEVAHNTPEKIIRVSVDPTIGLQGFHKRKLAFGLGLQDAQIKSFSKVVQGVYDAFVDKDAAQVEINPLIETAEGDFMALDAKINFDSNALYRHPDIQALRDEFEEDPLEIEASRHDLNYIKMDGTIGCMVNGAGLAMATMDIIKLYGSSPANFLDVGGGATKEKVKEAFKIILSDKNVKGILVNIFGGIMRCDIIADGIINAAKEIGIKVPVVVRLAGTNADIGKKMLNESGLTLIAANDLDDAAEKIVKNTK
ncbi:MAG: ADP-forming succinate--CoA ligase subunit beta [Alphaproteobacteria bacterium]|jgi:succinyl-CoA synthetase beta subunit|nr:ADP-forming succinate--CoA ligase subunit beta [Candidatus Jidaibacter sp.]